MSKKEKIPNMYICIEMKDGSLKKFVVEIQGDQLYNGNDEEEFYKNIVLFTGGIQTKIKEWYNLDLDVFNMALCKFIGDLTPLNDLLLFTSWRNREFNIETS